MKITKLQLKKIIKEEMQGSMNELRIDAPPDRWRGKGRKKAPTDAELDATWQRQQSPTYKGSGRLKPPENEIGLDLGDDSSLGLPLPRKRKAHLDNERKQDYLRRTALLPGDLDEDNEAEADIKAEVESIAKEIFYAAEDWIDDPLVGGGADRLKALGIGHNQKEHLKGSLLEFLRDFTAKLAGMEAKESAASDSTKPWLKIKPFEEGKKTTRSKRKLIRGGRRIIK